MVTKLTKFTLKITAGYHTREFLFEEPVQVYDTDFEQLWEGYKCTQITKSTNAHLIPVQPSSLITIPLAACTGTHVQVNEWGSIDPLYAGANLLDTVPEVRNQQHPNVRVPSLQQPQILGQQHHHNPDCVACTLSLTKIFHVQTPWRTLQFPPSIGILW